MTETQQLLAALKRELRVRHLTYRDVAKALGLSEPSVKRLFSSGRFTLDRLAALTGLLAAETDAPPKDLARDAYDIAYAMERERKERIHGGAC